MTTKTIDYYNNKAKDFHDKTINIDLSAKYKLFLNYLPKKASTLDAGCGAGRDTKYFLKMGYEVTAFDASKAMVEIANQETSINISQIYFHDMSYNLEFDGVWAEASLLHIPYEQTRNIYKKIHQALKPKGIFYASYGYGDDYIDTGGRDFWTMTEEKILPYLENIFEIITIWHEEGNNRLAPSPEQKWLNFIVGKK